MFCAQCGKKTKDGAKFCSACGAAIGAKELTPVEKKKPKEKGSKRMIFATGAVLVLVLVVVLLVSVIGNQGPKNNELKTDLEESLAGYDDSLQLSSVDVSNDRIENGQYTAEVKVIAESQYADLQLAANMVYILQDKEWTFSDCVWTRTGYEVKRYPSEEEMTAWVNDAAEIQCYSFVNQNKWENATLLFINHSNHIELTYQEMKAQDDSIVYTGAVDFSLGPEIFFFEFEKECLVSAKGTIQSVWRYKPDLDSWVIEDIDRDIEFTVVQGYTGDSGSGSNSLRYSFDSAGRLERFNDPKSAYEQKYEYDKMGRIVKIIGLNREGAVDSYQTVDYDETGNVTELGTHSASGSLGWRVVAAYNEMGQLTKETTYNAGGGVTGEEEFIYDEKGIVKLLHYNNTGDITSSYIYDDSGTLLEEIYYGENQQVSSRYRQLYDSAENFVAKIPVDENGNAGSNYSFDGEGRIISSSKDTLLDSEKIGQTYMEYQYSDTGILSKKTEKTECFDSTNRLLVFEGDITGFDSCVKEWTYDTEGNLIRFNIYDPTGSVYEETVYEYSKQNILD